MKYKRFWIASVFLLTISVFFFISFTSLDPDFGWHVTLGQRILTQGITFTDPFSYTMPSYPFVDHEWGTNIGIFLLYNFLGYIGTAFIFSCLAMVSLIPLLRIKKTQFVLVPALWVFSVLVLRIGIRPQVLSWVFWSFLLSVVIDEGRWKKYRWSIPVLLLVWVNIHGSFALGVAILWVVFLLSIIQKKDSIRKLMIACLGTIVTFFNPYGGRIWWEVFMQMKDVSLRYSVNEWAPIWKRPEFAFVFMVVLVAFVVKKYSKFVDKTHVIICIITFFLAISSIRHMPFFMLSAFPFSIVFFEQMFNQIKKNSFAKIRFWQFYRILFGISVLLFCLEIGLAVRTMNVIRFDSFYPARAVSFLQSKQFSGHVFSIYEWGGYLIWKYREQKVFIDGRMPSFSWKSPLGESDNAFFEYNQVLWRNNVQETIKKYSISLFLLPNISGKNSQKKYFFQLFPFLLFQEQQPLQEYLGSLGWKELYKDDVAVILGNPDFLRIE